MIVPAQRFADAAFALRNIRFQHRGRSHAGIDCAGLVFVAAWDCGLATPDFVDYERTPRAEVVLAAVQERCELRDWREWELPGRVVVLRHRDDGEPRHFAVSLGGWLAIHQERRARVVDLREQRGAIHSTLLLKGVG